MALKESQGKELFEQCTDCKQIWIMSKAPDSCSVLLYLKKRDFVCSKTGLLQRNTWLL